MSVHARSIIALLRAALHAAHRAGWRRYTTSQTHPSWTNRSGNTQIEVSGREVSSVRVGRHRETRETVVTTASTAELIQTADRLRRQADET